MESFRIKKLFSMRAGNSYRQSIIIPWWGKNQITDVLKIQREWIFQSKDHCILNQVELFDLDVTHCAWNTWPFNCSGHFNSLHRRPSALLSTIIWSGSMLVSGFLLPARVWVIKVIFDLVSNTTLMFGCRCWDMEPSIYDVTSMGEWVQ